MLLFWKYLQKKEFNSNAVYTKICSFLNSLRKAKSFELPHDKTNKLAVRPAQTQISLGIRPVWSESSLCAQWVAKDPSFLHADSEDWSDWADAQADLSLHLAHMPFCWFFHEAAHLLCLYSGSRDMTPYLYLY